MKDSTKLALAFLGGAAAGAAVFALVNRGKLDLATLRPLAAELVSKGLDLKDSVMARVEAIKEGLESLADEGRAHAQAEKRPSEPHPPSTQA